MYQEAYFPWNSDAETTDDKNNFFPQMIMLENIGLIGALLFVLYWDGNIEDAFKTELWLII